MKRSDTVLRAILPFTLTLILFTSSTPLLAADEPGTFSDCEGCPQMVKLQDRGYAIGKFEVTFDQWDACVADGGCNDYTPNDGRNNIHWGRADRPVIYISWNDAQAYLQWLSKKSGKTYRLPTGEEWEYACYAGNQTEYCGENSLAKVAWYESNSDDQTHPVGQKQANAFGLYDMSGNVWEWTDECGDASCTTRIIRGGAWLYGPQQLRAATHLAFLPTLRSSTYGFRVARTLP